MKHKQTIFFYLASFLIPILIFSVLLAAARITPFGNISPLRSDMNNQYVSYFAALKHIVSQHSWYSYSFTLGGNLFGLVTYYLMSPLNLIFLVVPLTFINQAITAITTIKIGLLGLTMGIFLKQEPAPNLSARLLPWLRLSLTTSYALSTFFIGFEMNIMWFDSFILLPLVLLAIDYLIKTGQSRWFIVTLSASVVLNYYIAFMIGFFSFLWLIYRQLTRFNTDLFWQRMRQYILASFASLSLTTIIWLPTLISLRGAKKQSFSAFVHPLTQFNAIKGFGRSFLAGTYGANMSGDFNNAPLIYASTFIIVLLITYYCANSIPIRHRLISLGLLCFMGLSTWFTPLDVFWHGGTPPIGFDGRFAFTIVFLTTILAYQGANALKAGINQLALLIINALIIIFIVVYHRQFPQLLTLKFSIVNITLLLLNFMLVLWLTNAHQNTKKLIAVTTSLLLLNLINVTLNDHHVLANNYNPPTTNTFDQFVNYTAPVLNSLPRLTTTNNRIEMDFSRSNNDPLLLNFPGVSHYSSSEPNNIKQFMGNLGYLRDMNWTNYSAGSSNFIDDYFGISNIVSDPHQNLSSAIDNDDYMGHSQPVSYGDPQIKQNNRKGLTVTHHTEALPLLFPLQKNNTKDKLNASLENVFQNQNILATGLFARKIMSPAKIQTVSDLRYSVMPTQDGEVYLALPATNFPNFLEWAPINIQRNDFKKSLVTYNFGENSVLDLGPGTKDVPFVVTIKPTIPNVQTNQPIIASSPKASTLKNALLDVKKQVKTQRVNGSHIRASVYGNQNQSILLTLPFDAGWHLTINGKSYPISKAYGALITFKLPHTGKNLIKLSFMPRGFKVGMIVSIASITILVIIFILQKRRQTA